MQLRGKPTRESLHKGNQRSQGYVETAVEGFGESGLGHRAGEVYLAEGHTGARIIEVSSGTVRDQPVEIVLSLFEFSQGASPAACIVASFVP